MINLLPPSMKSELKSARINTMLRKYLFTLFAALVAALLIFGTAFYINHINQQTYAQQLAESTKELSALDDVRKQAAIYNKDFATAKQIFESQVKLSQVIVAVSETLPPGAVMTNISLSVEELTEPVTITVKTNTFEKGGVVQRNFANSEVFASVTLQGVQEGAGESRGAYPFTATLEVALAPSVAVSKEAAR